MLVELMSRDGRPTAIDPTFVDVAAVIPHDRDGFNGYRVTLRLEDNQLNTFYWDVGDDEIRRLLEAVKNR